MKKGNVMRILGMVAAYGVGAVIVLVHLLLAGRDGRVEDTRRGIVF